MQHEPLQDRPAGDRQHRFRNVIGQRGEPDPSATRHDDRDVVPLTSPGKPAFGVDRDDSPLLVDNRYVPQAQGPHQIDHLGPAHLRLGRDPGVFDERIRRRLEAGAGEQGPADLAFADRADQSAGRIGDERTRRAGPVDRLERGTIESPSATSTSAIRIVSPQIHGDRYEAKPYRRHQTPARR